MAPQLVGQTEVFSLASAKKASSKLQSKTIILFSFIISAWSGSFICLHKQIFMFGQWKGGWPDQLAAIWLSWVSPSVWSSLYLATAATTQLILREGRNFSFEILTQGGTHILSFVPLRVAEIIETFKMIYTNYERTTWRNRFYPTCYKAHSLCPVSRPVWESTFFILGIFPIQLKRSSHIDLKGERVGGTYMNWLSLSKPQFKSNPSSEVHQQGKQPLNWCLNSPLATGGYFLTLLRLSSHFQHFWFKTILGILLRPDSSAHRTAGQVSMKYNFLWLRTFLNSGQKKRVRCFLIEF